MADLDKAAQNSVPQGKLPRSWDSIDVGHIVLVDDSSEFGWWPCLVLKREDQVLTLRLRDYPDKGTYVRHVAQVALIKPVQRNGQRSKASWRPRAVLGRLVESDFEPAHPIVVTLPARLEEVDALPGAKRRSPPMVSDETKLSLTDRTSHGLATPVTFQAVRHCFLLLVCAHFGCTKTKRIVTNGSIELRLTPRIQRGRDDDTKA
jgi:hypothetical protein